MFKQHFYQIEYLYSKFIQMGQSVKRGIFYILILGAISASSHAQVSWQKIHSPNESFHTIHTSGSGIIYAANVTYGVFKSVNNGDIWLNISAGLPDSTVREIQVATDEKLFVGTGSHGIYQFNNGIWTAINNGLPVNNTLVSSLAKGSNGVMYMMNTGGQIFSWNGSTWLNITYNFPALGKSILASPGGTLLGAAFTYGVYAFDGVNQWNLIGNAMPNNFVLKLAVTNQDTIYALCNSNNIFKCHIGGGNWVYANNGLPAANMNFILADSSNRLYTSPATGTAHIYRSVNGGTTWSIATSGLSTTSFRCMALHVSGAVFTGASGVFVSHDGGNNWIDKNYNLDAPRSIFSFYSARNGKYYAGTKVGVWRSDNSGMSWKLKSNGINHLNILQIMENAAGEMLLHGYNSIPKGGIYRSVNQGENWSLVAANGCDLYTKLKQHRADTIWATSRFNGTTSLSFSVNNGANWQNNPLDISAIFDIDVTKDHTIFLGSESEGVSRSDNGGQTFQLGIGGSIPWYGNVLEIERDENGVIFAGGDWWNNTLWFSNPGENGDVWTRFTDPDLVVHGIQDIIFDVYNNVYLACENGGMKMAYNNTWSAGTNFINISTGLSSLNANILELNFDTSGYLFAVAYTNNALGGGLFRSVTTVNPTQSSVFTFIGNGDWGDTMNWHFQRKPPLVLNDNQIVIIDPLPGGECVVHGQIQANNNSIVKIRPGRQFRVVE